MRYNFKVGDRVKLTGDSWPAVMRDQIVTVTADDSVHPEIKWNGAFFYVFPESGWDAVLVLPEEEEPPTEPIQPEKEVEEMKADENLHAFDIGDVVRLTGEDWANDLKGREITVEGVEDSGRAWFRSHGDIWWIYRTSTYNWSATLVTPAHLAAKVKEAEVVEEIQELDERDYFLPGDLVRLTGAGWAEEGMQGRVVQITDMDTDGDPQFQDSPGSTWAIYKHGDDSDEDYSAELVIRVRKK